MRVERAIPVVLSDDLAASRRLYVDVLGFEVGMDFEGFLMLRSPAAWTTQVIVLARTGPCMDPAARQLHFSAAVEDVDAAHAEALAAGLDIVYPLTDEPWGVRRFFVRDPSGTVFNLAGHL